MKRINKKLDQIATYITAYALVIAFILACIGLDVLAIKWVLSLLGVI